MPKKKNKKPEFSKRVLDKKKRSARGEGIYYDEVKEKLNLTVTPTAKKMLGELALENSLSRSEWTERIIKSEHQKMLEDSDRSD